MRLLTLAGLLLPCVLVPAQAPPIDTGTGTVACNSRYVFVLRGDVLYQFDADTLRLRRQTRLPADPAPAPDEAIEPDTVEIAEPAREPAVGPPPEVRRTGLAAPPRPIPSRYLGRDASPQRLALVGGGDAAVAVERALTWLVEHQDADGRWDADGFAKHDEKGAPCDGPGQAVHDIGVTGLAVLALLADGNVARKGPHHEAVAKAVAWLCDEQDPETGLIGSNATHEFVYGHAIATCALVEAAGLSGTEAIRRCAERAVRYLQWHRNPYSVWRYQPRDNDNDTSVTSWCVSAIATARDFGLEVEGGALRIAESWFEAITDPVSGRSGYTRRGEASARLAGDHGKRFPADSSEALTAAALFCRAMLGRTPDDTPILGVQADLVLAKPPRAGAEHTDHYAWYYGSQALARIGGRHWERWSQALHDNVLPRQRTDGNFRGSWDPDGPWGGSGGRVYSTAMLCLALQAPYRHR